MVGRRFNIFASFHSPSAVMLTVTLHQCGHLAGKVLVPTSSHTSRLISARFQLDLLNSTMLLIARTDSESAKLISSTVDVDDHEYLLGTTTKAAKSLAQVLSEAEARGAVGPEIDKLEVEWTSSHKLCTFNQGWTSPVHQVTATQSRPRFYIAVEAAIQQSNIPTKAASYDAYLTAATGKSNGEAREIARQILGKEVFWDWDRRSIYLNRARHSLICSQYQFLVLGKDTTNTPAALT